MAKISIPLELTVEVWGDSVNPEDYFDQIAAALGRTLDDLADPVVLNWTLAQEDR